MAWYRTGTVSITAGATSVTGVGTSFASNARVGDGLRAPDGNWYEIVNIASEVTLGIYPAYEGATVATSANWVIAPMQGYVKQSADRLRQLIDSLGYTDSPRLKSIAQAVTNVNDILIADTATTLAALATGANGRLLIGSATPASSRTAIGATSVGNALITAVSTAAGRAALGSTVTGDALFVASTPAAARTTLGSGATGDALFGATTPAVARTTLGAGATGNTLFTSATPAAARTAIELWQERTVLTANTSADNLLEIGRIYFVQGSTVTNLAIAMTGWITVDGAGDPAGDMRVIQSFIPWEPANINPRVWKRNRGSTGTWSAWVRSDIGSLGTAANGVLTVSTTDTTTNRVLKVGDFGYGSTVAPTLSTADNATGSGMYQMASNAGSIPVAANGVLEHISWNGVTSAVQRFATVVAPFRQFIRLKTGNVWQAWSEEFHSTAPLTGYVIGANTAIAATDTMLGALGKLQAQINATVPVSRGGTGGTTQATARSGLGLGSAAVAAILGTVSQSGGVPTGSIYEYVDNANGKAIKFADGTMICWFYGSTSYGITNVGGALFHSQAIGCTFPVPFAASSVVPVAIPMSISTANFYSWGAINSTANLTNFVMHLVSPASNASAYAAYIAIGRWF